MATTKGGGYATMTAAVTDKRRQWYWEARGSGVNGYSKQEAITAEADRKR
jgi:hypothetical protein